MRTHRMLFSLLALVPAAIASGQTITPLVLEGDNVPGVGLVVGFDRIAVNDAGDWVVVLDTNNANPNTDRVLLKNGVLVQRSGAFVATPVGALNNGFVSTSLRGSGDIAHVWGLTNSPGAPFDNAAVYVNSTLVLSKGSPPLTGGWGSFSTRGDFTDVAFNANNKLFLRGVASDPSTAILNDWYASVLHTNGSFGLTGETLLARAGQILPGQTLAVNWICSGHDAGAINASGKVIYCVDLDPAYLSYDGVVYLWNGTANVRLAQETQPAPVPGRFWSSLDQPELALNDAGDWLIKDGLYAGTSLPDPIIVKNNAKFVQKGDNLPAIGAFTFYSFGNAPVSLTAAGNVLWYGAWNDPTFLRDTGIFLDQTLLVQKGVTVVNGATFNMLGNMSDWLTPAMNGSMYVSSNARFVIFTGRLGAPVDKRGIFLLDRFGQVSASCLGDGSQAACPCGNSGAMGHGCASSAFPGGALLSASGFAGASASTDTLVLTATDMQGQSLFLQANALTTPPLPFGDGQLCAASNILRLGVVFPAGGVALFPGGSTPAPIHVAGGPIAAGDTKHYQCWYRSQPALCGGNNYNLTQALTILWGL